MGKRESQIRVRVTLPMSTFQPSRAQQNHCLCMAHTSLWFVIPALHAHIQQQYTHALLSILACIFSIVHWTHYQLYSRWFWLDIACVNLTILCYLYNAPPHIFPVQVSCIACAGVFFVHACVNELGSYRGLATHLWFRYLCYCGMMVNVVDWSFRHLLWHTMMYVMSILLSVVSFAFVHYNTHKLWWLAVAVVVALAWTR